MVGNAVGTEQNFGDLTIARLVRPPVDSAKHQAQAAALLLREAMFGLRRAPVKRPPEAFDFAQAIETIRVERYDRGERSGRRGAAEDHDLDVDIAGTESDVLAIVRRDRVGDREGRRGLVLPSE